MDEMPVVEPTFETADVFSWTAKRGPGPGIVTEYELERSKSGRGLAIAQLAVRGGHDGLFSLFSKHTKVYFTTVGFDLSGDPASAFPPAEFKGLPVTVTRNEPTTFTLGDGVPLWGPKQIVGALYVYVLVSESDATSRAIGTKLSDINDALTKTDGVLDKVKELLTNPGAAAAKQVLSILSTAVLPISKLLADNQDDAIALFQGSYSATGGWAGRLRSTQADCELTLVELPRLDDSVPLASPVA